MDEMCREEDIVEEKELAKWLLGRSDGF